MSAPAGDRMLLPAVSCCAMKLTAIKLVHTAIWAVFAGAIVAIPVAAVLGAWAWTLGLAGLVLVEVAVLAGNGWTCPLTAVAARHTADRAPNFDIYLPRWLAEHNKTVFGWLYVAGLAVAAACWAAHG